jgi:hypothetical protein
MFVAPSRDPKLLEPVFGRVLGSCLLAWNQSHPRDRQIGAFELFRTGDRQKYLYALGRTLPSTSPCYHAGVARKVGSCAEHPLGAVVTMAGPGLSWHEYGVAADIVFDANPEKPDLQASWDGKFPWAELGAHGQSFGLEWAGAWKRFREMPHFQLTRGLQISHALELKNQGGLPAVWEALAEAA